MNELLLDIRNQNEWVKERFKNKDIITLEELLGDYQDLISEVEHLEEKIKDMEQDIEENYEQISVWKQVL